MSNLNELTSNSSSSLIKLENALKRLQEDDSSNESVNEKLADTLSLFRGYFENLSEPEFKPIYLRKGDVASSEDYNKNLQSIYNDLSRFYEDLSNYDTASQKAFNYSQIVVEQIRKKAEQLSSIVLDLRIFSNFTRGDVIVAGDDFINNDFIDSTIGLGSAKAEMIPGGAGLSLAREGTNPLSQGPGVEIDIIPVSPSSNLANITAPTPGNLERFYEGNYYNFLGEARPEAGEFNIQTFVNTGNLSGLTSGNASETQEELVLVEFGASEEDKRQARLKMIDGNPDTFWECEYLFKLEESLRSDIDELVVNSGDPTTGDPSSGGEDTSGITTLNIEIDQTNLNSLALQEDLEDLIVDIVVTLPFEQNVNFVSVNPLLFSNKAYVEVMDISTTNDSQVDFVTVDNWAELQYPKTITPEANEFLTESQQGSTLAPSRFSYGGQGVYPFPVTVANKVKIRLLVKDPISQVYERTYVLTKNVINMKETVTTSKSKGIFGKRTNGVYI